MTTREKVFSDPIRDKELRQIAEEGAVSTPIGNMEEHAAREEGRCVPDRLPTASTGGGVVSNHQHSPLPWTIDVIGPTDMVVDSAGQAVCDNEDFYPMPVSRNNQALIVEAVNQHAALLSQREVLLTALRAAVGFLRNAKIDLETGAPKRTAVNTISGGITVAAYAIALVEGK